MEGMLTRRIGFLPAWAWGAIIGGGILAAMWWRSRSSGTAGAADGTATDATGADMSGTAAGDSSDIADIGPSNPYGGFNDSPPPAYPPPGARIDPALLKAVRNLDRDVRKDEERRRRNTKRHKAAPKRHPHPPVRNYPGGNPGGPPRRHVAAHFAESGPERPGVM